jgi:hypothetical protein
MTTEDDCLEARVSACAPTDEIACCVDPDFEARLGKAARQPIATL